ncbi:uncharacterized protein LOC133903254 [Phragmites australis]|uniref:uncharacterized protein LOC133903254 n=1 Tax=Phragmites australis TaxID=29695 RepID=UPI002D76A53B|nr:uncharacterized protein LOC133903254 [Phragmites australis]
MTMFSSESSDKEDELLLLVTIEEDHAASEGRSRQRGSVPGHAVIDRDHSEGAARLYRDYFANNPVYDMGYYLGDGIYPDWATIVKAISAPRGNKSVHFSAMQAAVCKDVERAFGVLQSRFAIVRRPARVWDQSTLQNIMTACVIMHNMIIEDENGDASTEQVFDYMGETTTVHRYPDQGILHYVEATQAIRNRAMHHQLREDLVEHLWSLHGAH